MRLRRVFTELSVRDEPQNRPTLLYFVNRCQLSRWPASCCRMLEEDHLAVSISTKSLARLSMRGLFRQIVQIPLSLFRLRMARAQRP